jgi:chromosome segregation ATPase
MQTLDEQLTKYKEQLNSKDREILQLKSQLNNNLEQQATIKSHTQRQTNQNDNWNKEVRNLDARISDVLGKIKERELMLNNYDEWERKFKELEKKYETKTNEIIELNKKLSEKTNENEILKQKLVEEQNQQNLRLQQQQRKISLHDFDDDLGRVLMSKEDVITQLEKSNEDKDKQIYKLNDDLQQQNLKYQELVQNECKKSQNIINETIQHYSNKLSNTEYEFEQLSNELNRLNIYIDQQDSRINDLTKTKHDLESKVYSINESTRNEIENLQEEVKTLEFKLAHSHKELCDYKNLLNSIDLSSAKNDGKVEKLEQELNEVKNENNYLNEHIYALDEFIRDKEAQNDHYENEIEKLKRLNQTLMNEKQELENEFNNNFILNYFNSNQNELVKEFCTRLNALSYHLNKINENSQVKQIDFNNDQLIIDIFSKPLDEIKNNHQFLSEMQAKPRKLNIKKFKVYLTEVKRTIKSLEKFYTTDILKYNQHVLTYITEQIVHKATLNGHLKFACELLRKKCTDSLILIPNASSSSSSSASAGGGTINNTITTASSTPIVSTSCSQANTFSSVMNNTQINSLSSNGSTNGNLHEFNSLTRDEKICKIASELLLCDEDSLRK